MARRYMFSNNLTALREEKGLSLTQVAEAVGLSKARLSSVEKGYQQISQNLKQKLQKLYNLTDDEWLVRSISYSRKEGVAEGSSGEPRQHSSMKTGTSEKVSNSSVVKEVEATFIWTPKKKPVKLYRLLQLNLR